MSRFPVKAFANKNFYSPKFCTLGGLVRGLCSQLVYVPDNTKVGLSIGVELSTTPARAKVWADTYAANRPGYNKSYAPSYDKPYKKNKYSKRKRNRYSKRRRR